MTRSRLFEPVTEWFRTRWAALGWLPRLFLVPLAALNAFVLVGAIVTGTWGSVTTGLSGLALAAIIADWQYWETRSRLEGPFARIGVAVAARFHRGDQKVVLRAEGDEWVMTSE